MHTSGMLSVFSNTVVLLRLVLLKSSCHCCCYLWFRRKNLDLNFWLSLLVIKISIPNFNPSIAFEIWCSHCWIEIEIKILVSMLICKLKVRLLWLIFLGCCCLVKWWVKTAVGKIIILVLDFFWGYKMIYFNTITIKNKKMMNVFLFISN
jgi:hypothetical protein